MLPALLRRGQTCRAQSCTKAGSAGHEDPFLYREGGRALEQAAREAVGAPGLSVPKGLWAMPSMTRFGLFSALKVSGSWT